MNEIAYTYDFISTPQPQARSDISAYLIALQVHVARIAWNLASQLDGPDSCERLTSGYLATPTRLFKLLESSVERFAHGTRYVPQGARRVLAPNELPPALERIAMRVERSLQTWFAWADEKNAWFLVAEMAHPDGYRQGDAVRMYFYDADGRFLTWGTWAVDAEHRWILCEF